MPASTTKPATVLAKASSPLEHVVSLAVGTEEIVARLRGRNEQEGRSDDDEATVRRVMRAGASGFVSKSYSADDMLMALRQVLAGEVVEPFSAPTVLAADTPVPPAVTARAKDLGLSPRQAEVLSLMAKGRSNRDIASLLGLTEGTVKIHVTAIFRALGVASRTQALVALARLKIRI